MKHRSFTLLLSVVLLLTGSCTSNENQPANANVEASRIKPPQGLVQAMAAIEPFFRPMGKPGPYDWLATYREKGQTFEEYINENPTVPTETRRTIYIQPLGKFTLAQSKVIKITAEYISAFYRLPVKLLPEKGFTTPVRPENFRTGTNTSKRQIRTGFILDEVLRPILPQDAAALIAFTNEDLFPDASMNYVFGQASLENRVGVWSLLRLDDAANADTFLHRTLKIAVHEIGHVFGMRHCTKYQCVMSGTNHLGETDSRPIDACPECMAKVCWMTMTGPKSRYERLTEFCARNGLKHEAEEFRRKVEALR